jgi:hypothetical protein
MQAPERHAGLGRRHRGVDERHLELANLPPPGRFGHQSRHYDCQEGLRPGFPAVHVRMRLPNGISRIGPSANEGTLTLIQVEREGGG